MEYWLGQTELINNKSDILTGIAPKANKNALGILEGLAGIGLMQLFAGQLNHETI